MRVTLALAFVACALGCPKPEIVCEDARIDGSDDVAGLEVCTGDDVNSVDDPTCPAALPNDPCTPALSCGAGSTCACTTDEECGSSGRCETDDDGCHCESTCATDADCESDEVCLCGSTTGVVGDSTVIVARNECVRASCKTGADCASGACGVSFAATCDGRPRELACRDAARDECGIDAKLCGSGERCFFDERWACVAESCD